MLSTYYIVCQKIMENYCGILLTFFLTLVINLTREFALYLKFEV